MYYNEMGGGFHDIGTQDPGGFSTNPNTDTGNPNNPGYWDSVNYPTLHTRTMTWDYSSYKAAVTSTSTAGWTEFMITTQAGNFSPPVAFYFDNIRFITPPAPPVGVPGDYNEDDVVNAADYTIWRNNLGTTFQLPNEVSGVTPGFVTVEDYSEWKARFGDVPPGAGGGALASSAAVPEPSTWLLGLAVSSIVGLFGRRARRPRIQSTCALAVSRCS